MTREYVIGKSNKPRSDEWRLEDADGKDCLARTVFEDHELIDIGLTDKNGEPIMARQKRDQVGYVRFNSSG